MLLGFVAFLGRGATGCLCALTEFVYSFDRVCLSGKV